MDDTGAHAPGHPGLGPTWANSRKMGVGTSVTAFSHVWFTLADGILTEIFHPAVDLACMRDMQFLVTDGPEFFSEERRDTHHEVSWFDGYIPAYRVVNTCVHGRYRLTKEIVADPRLSAVVQRALFEPLSGEPGDYHLYLLLAPHLGNRGAGNTAWVGEYKGVPMLFAERSGQALAVASSIAWRKRSAGFVGISDGWQDVHRHHRMHWQYRWAVNGNVALCGELAADGARRPFTIAVGFGNNPYDAGNRAVAALSDDFDEIHEQYADEWKQWHRMSRLPDGFTDDIDQLCRRSLSTIRVHQAKHFPGCSIASVSIPWGEARGDEELGGYHLVWVRDLVETAGALLAAGAHSDIVAALKYLQSIQEADGHWAQNMWVDSRPYWNGIQLDETAFPVLLINMAEREAQLRAKEIERFWPMVRKAASYLVRHGPVTPQDRWEEESGYSPFTLAAEIAALLVSADMADRRGETSVAKYLRETADTWNARIETWTYVTGTELARKYDVEGYYVRIAPPQKREDAEQQKFMPVKHRPAQDIQGDESQVVSPDALALVRFGLRAANDPHILNTIKVVDATLRVEFPWGPGWHRYSNDCYGEQEDGSPFNGSGIGRVWPLLTGERGHYEVAAGNIGEARRLLRAMAAFAGAGGLLPEQTWDTQDIPQHGLHFGRPSGSAMPLVWAHAEYIKLARSITDREVFDMPHQTRDRYRDRQPESPFQLWRYNHKSRRMPAGKTLRIELLKPAEIVWTSDGWKTAVTHRTCDTGLDLHVADLPTRDLNRGTKITMTFHWSEADRWEGKNFEIEIFRPE